MSVPLADVTHWLLLSAPGGNVGHVLMGQSPGSWYSTACGTYTPNGEVVTELPRRICQRCVAALPGIERKG